jgi:hypothetical protein
MFIVLPVVKICFLLRRPEFAHAGLMKSPVPFLRRYLSPVIRQAMHGN